MARRSFRFCHSASTLPLSSLSFFPFSSFCFLTPLYVPSPSHMCLWGSKDLDDDDLAGLDLRPLELRRFRRATTEFLAEDRERRR